jgi:hypothetical protein
MRNLGYGMWVRFVVNRATLLLYKVRALAARDMLMAALCRGKDRPAARMSALHYERATVYEALGQAKRTLGDLEKIYAADPGHEDVLARLQVG